MNKMRRASAHVDGLAAARIFLAEFGAVAIVLPSTTMSCLPRRYRNRCHFNESLPTEETMPLQSMTGFAGKKGAPDGIAGPGNSVRSTAKVSTCGFACRRDWNVSNPTAESRLAVFLARNLQVGLSLSGTEVSAEAVLNEEALAAVLKLRERLAMSSIRRRSNSIRCFPFAASSTSASRRRARTSARNATRRYSPAWKGRSPICGRCGKTRARRSGRCCSPRWSASRS